MNNRLLTPTKITAWLDCAHYLTLREAVDDGSLSASGRPFGPMAQLLMDKGTAHELDCLEHYRSQGLSVLEVPQRQPGETFEQWVHRVGNPYDRGHDVIFQMPFIHDGIRGIADFLIRVENPITAEITYEPVDAKLARTSAKPGHVLQLCFYADALYPATGQRCESIHIWLGSGKIETLRVDEFRPYWSRLRQQLRAVLSTDGDIGETEPEPCVHCDFCEFAGMCEDTWRATDSLVYVAGIRTLDREALAKVDVTTLAQLAALDEEVADIQSERLQRIVQQAALQLQGRDNPTLRPPFDLVESCDDPMWGRGFEQLPEPDEGDVFLDYEGHPFWRADVGLFFLLGLIARNQHGEWEYRTFWAHTREEEADAASALIDYLVEHRNTYPGMHVYHYNHTERSSLERMASDHGVGEAKLSTLVETGLFVDLLLVARNAMQVGTESYGLKDLEQLTGFERGHDIDAGAGAVVEYESFMNTSDQGSLDRIAAYNEDDVRATLALRDWLIGQRPPGTVWRTAVLEPEEAKEELETQIAALYEFPADTPQHLLGHLLGYWLREHKAFIAPKLAKLDLDSATLLDVPDTIAGLTWMEQIERHGARGLKLPGMAFTFEDQAIESGFTKPQSKAIYRGPEGETAYADIDYLDREAGELCLVWNQASQDKDIVPSVVVLNDWIPPRPKPESLSELADRVLGAAVHGSPNPVSWALLGRDLPVFKPGFGPDGGMFDDDLDSILGWVAHLDSSYVAIQGPPGTGKTYRGGHIVHALVVAGMRVGITAMSHSAIDTLLKEVVQVFEDKGDIGLLNARRRGPEPGTGPLAGVKYKALSKACAKADVNLVAGTTWLFAGNDMADSPVDVLIVDEAGQLALADALAASRSAHNLILLGDPLQLAQVSQASHPGGGGHSVLEHVLGTEATMPSDRGVFLSETRRMHPDVCRFISEEIYQGRLYAHESCAYQGTERGTGLRWLRVEHSGCTTESVVEADAVAVEIAGMVGSMWADLKGVERPLTVEDFMVVAPYNDQVGVMRERLDADEQTRGVRVGTVDKFQGGEAPVVFFTMTSSDASNIKRGPDFLFSRNRLNVAISRARCLAYLVCTEELVNTRASDVEGMRLLSTLCSFVEYCEHDQMKPDRLGQSHVV